MVPYCSPYPELLAGRRWEFQELVAAGASTTMALSEEVGIMIQVMVDITWSPSTSFSGRFLIRKLSPGWRLWRF